MSIFFRNQSLFQMRVLKVYVSIGFLLAVYVFCKAYFFKNLETKVYGVSVLNLSVTIHFVLISVILIKSILDYTKRGIVCISLIFLVILSFLLFALLGQKRSAIGHYAYGIAAFGLIIYSLIYFFRASRVVLNKSLLTDPVFWIVVGVFISMGIVFPLSILKGVMFNYSETILKLCNVFISLAYSTFYLFIAKAFYDRKRG
jgi:hypothetical protein